MKKKLHLLLILAVIGLQSYAQELISNSGDYQANSLISLSWSLGEMNVESISSGNLMLTQGFHQPSYTITRIENGIHHVAQVQVYPNPVATSMYIVSPQNNSNYVISDIQGNIIKQGSINIGTNKIDVSGFSSSMYFLNITSSDNKVFEKFRIVKQ
ncbi:MAG: hypothetical protein CVU05_11785 [Bacteroidetes bacterium HGW-Bacteroidetes-21]|jgi:hypothetical protein|nr:MAG: hypothetical protein CVU05_11785 [Bacteroidetes bacterium HGW-Bacteroidetes-21]